MQGKAPRRAKRGGGGLRQAREDGALAEEVFFVRSLDGAEHAGADHEVVGIAVKGEGVGADAIDGAGDAGAEFLVAVGAVAAELKEAFAGFSGRGVEADEALLEGREL